MYGSDAYAVSGYATGGGQQVPPQKVSIGTAQATSTASPMGLLLGPITIPLNGKTAESTHTAQHLQPMITTHLGVAAGNSRAQKITPMKPPDPFTYPWVISGEEGAYVAFDMSDGNMEAGEPNPNGVTRTSWFQWTAPDDFTSEIRMHTRGSNVDTALAVFTGTDLAALTQIAVSDDASGIDADLTFTPVGGTTYMIQVGAKADPASSINFTWLNGDPVEEDAFATPLIIDDAYGFATTTVTNGTVEAGEPVTADIKATSWISWTPDSSDPASFSVRSVDSLPFTAAIFTGSSLATLQTVVTASGDGSAPLVLDFSPVAGTTYLLRIAGTDTIGDFEVSWDTDSSAVDPEPVPEPLDVPTQGRTAPMVALRCEVYERDGKTLITELPRRVGISFQEALNVTGTGAVAVKVDDAIFDGYPDLFHWGNIVKFFIGSKCAHGFLIRDKETTWVSNDEYKGWLVNVSGPSVQYYLDDFIIRHDGSPRPDSSSSRYYSWASAKGEWYKDSDWPAVEEHYTLDNPPSKAKKNKPKNWRVRNAQWILSRGHYRYYRKSVHIPDDGTLVRIMATADEYYKVYIDGEQILEDKNIEVGYTKFKRADIVLDKGWHIIGAYVRGINTAKKGDGNDAFLFAMCELDLNGKIIKPAIVVSDSSWVCHVGNPPPGWNRAQVLRNAVKEAQARGINAATRLSFGFDGTKDSYGKLWKENSYNKEVRIGTSGLDLQAQLSEGNGFDVWVDPADLTIQAYKRRGKNKATSVTIEPGRNLIDWKVQAKDEVLNDWLISYDGGWTEYKAKGSIKDYDEREGYVELGSIKDDKTARHIVRNASLGYSQAQTRAGTGDVHRRAYGQPNGGVIGVHGAFPFLDYNVGDTISAPNSRGKLVPMRVLALTCNEDENGYLTFDPEVEELRTA